ncbi:MAG: MerR family transcriptional regulator [Candidatus Omnitrophica bacterium]|nr:MerR family transcriptional regulator [Candidatus Omnitrophota bacterium]
MKSIYVLKDLAVMSGHSIYTIKYYLNLGLIKEIGRSPDTHIRFFDDSTLETLNRIRQLKQKNIPLTEIRRILLGEDEA